MGDKGGVALGKALQTNHTLKELKWDGNATRLVGFQAFKVGFERNSSLTNMPLPILDISECLKAEAARLESVRNVIMAIERALNRNQNPKSKLQMRKKGTGGGFGGLVSAGEREEIQKVKTRIKNSGKELKPTEQKLMKDADENDTHRAQLFFLQEEVQQAMEDEVKAKCAKFAQDIFPEIQKTQEHLRQKILESVKKNYQSLDAGFVQNLQKDLVQESKTITQDEIVKLVVVQAGAQISAEATEALISTVATASDLIFAHLMDSLENVLHTAAPVRQHSEGGGGGSGVAAAASPVKPGVPVGLAAAIQKGPPRKAPPAVPPKAVPEKKGDSKPAAAQKDGDDDSGSVIGEAPSSKSGNMSHLVKDRPMGPKRRRPQRAQQQRPMMNVQEGS
eukprot:TRINITY_DN18157_c0_g1_i2.p1 TRINITY_DN18157_c0_g1~~TRINITY_DN18157_c0_g1_i2.p1  ORF type:complete len:392 (+),score=138.83 TRINITY_DN18157_c0_g1_i2:264-1439(+)